MSLKAIINQRFTQSIIFKGALFKRNVILECHDMEVCTCSYCRENYRKGMFGYRRPERRFDGWYYFFMKMIPRNKQSLKTQWIYYFRYTNFNYERTRIQCARKLRKFNNVETIDNYIPGLHKFLFPRPVWKHSLRARDYDRKKRPIGKTDLFLYMSFLNRNYLRCRFI